MPIRGVVVDRFKAVHITSLNTPLVRLERITAYCTYVYSQAQSAAEYAQDAAQCVKWCHADRCHDARYCFHDLYEEADRCRS